MLISNNIYHINQDGTKTKIDIGQPLIYKNIIQPQASDNVFNIQLDNNCTDYMVTPTAASTISFDITQLSVPDSMILEFNLMIEMSDGVQTITFPDSLTWVNGVAPSLNTAKLYKLNIISFDKGTSFKGWLIQ